MNSHILEYTQRININSIKNKDTDYTDYYNNRIRIEKEAVYFGGYRYFFRCSYCNRKVKDLFYNHKGVLACRHCYNLKYFNWIYRNMALENYYKISMIENKIDKLNNTGHKKKANKLFLKLHITYYKKAIQELKALTNKTL